MATEFMNHLYTKFITEKHTTASSAKEYIRRLTIANCDKPFGDLKFLKNKDKVEECLQKYKPTTRRNVYTAIVSACNLVNDKKTSDKYYKDMIGEPNPHPNEKTETQQKNWIDWKQILEIKKRLHDSMDTWETRFKYFLLCLYTDIPPRRNLDYIKMEVVPKYTDGLPKTKNYISLEDGRMVFNVYKTAKHYGQQVLDTSPEFKEAFVEYIKHHPLKRYKQYPLLVNTQGGEWKTSGAMTNMLNRLFGKKVGASMLRHIYLSNKYGNELTEMKQDAEAMGHSLNEQRDYIKK